MTTDYKDVSKQVIYELLHKQTAALLADERDAVANMANLSALLYETLEDVNWAGFYRMVDNQLIVGPFQGKVACVRIAVGDGVCGRSVEEKRTLVVNDVHQFEGHIACDSASNSEIVVPLIRNGRVMGVLDIDSPSYARFDQADKMGLEKLVDLFIKHTEI